MSEYLVHLITALPAEAKPLVSRFNLKRVQPERAFPVYRNQHISLVVSGVSKTNAAAASGGVASDTCNAAPSMAVRNK